MLTAPGYAVAAGLLLPFCVINLFGVRWFARLNTAIVRWKIAIIVLVVVVFLVLAFDGGHLTAAGGFTPYGAHGSSPRSPPVASCSPPSDSAKASNSRARPATRGAPGWQALVGFRPRPFRLRGGPVVPFLAFWSSNLIVYWSGWVTDWKLFVAVLLGLALFGVHELVNRRSTPPVDFRHGLWVLPWLGGLALISYLGSYPDPGEGAGNLGVIGFSWGFLATFLLSAFIMWLAQHHRLPSVRVAELVPDPDAERPAGAEPGR